MVSPPIPDSEARQAIDALGGYAYQLYQTLLAWFNLGPGEFLFIEVAEDYAIATASRLEASQVRRTAAKLTLRSQHTLSALNSLWRLKQKNPNQAVSYRYLTTSEYGRESGWSFPDGKPGLEYWRLAARPGADVKPIRDALATLNLDFELSSFIQTASAEDFRRELLASVHWDCGESSLEELHELAGTLAGWRAKEVAHATASAGKSLVLPLIGHLLQVATTKGLRRLDSVALDEFIQERLLLQVPRRVVNDLLVKQLGDVDAGNTEFRTASLVINLEDALLPAPLSRRPQVVENLKGNLAQCGVLFLHGSSGKGKSTLAKLLAGQMIPDWEIVDFRGVVDAPTCNRQLVSTASRASQGRASFLLDDLPVGLDSNIEHLVSVLARLLRRTDRLLLVTCSDAPSSRILHLLGLDAASSFEVPNLSEEEVGYLISELGGDAETWKRITHAICGGGHPQLVMARLRRLKSQGWPQDEIIGGFHPAKPVTEIDDEKAAVRKRLLAEIDPATRRLLDRLSLIGGKFDRPLGLAVGLVEPKVESAGDAITQLTGPWIERSDQKSLRLSPLLEGTGNQNLTAAEAKEIRIAIVNELIGRQPIDGAFISTIFLHALASDCDFVLAKLFMVLLNSKGNERRYAADQLVGIRLLTRERLIRPENPHVSVFLRMAQFIVNVEHEAWETAEKVAQRLFEEARMLSQDEMQAELTAFAISLVLSEIRLPKSPNNWLALLTDYRRLTEATQSPLNQEMRAALKKLEEQHGAKEYQYFFAICAMRRSSLAELERLFIGLDALPADEREELLEAFNNDGPSDPKLLISNAWLGEAEKGTLNGQEAAETLETLSKTAESWGQKKLAVECLSSASVMLDEYAEDPEAATELLDKAVVRFGSCVEFSRERAKVLYRKGDHDASLQVIRDIEDTLADPVECVFAFRSAGISAAELKRWPEAIEFFEKAREAGLKTQGDTSVMATGFLGDIAACYLWAGNIKLALMNARQALEEVEKREPPTTPNEIYTRHLIGHIPVWMDHELFDSEHLSQYRDLAPGKCSQPDPIPAVLERPIYPLDICWYQLCRVELLSDQDAGIRAQLRSWPDHRKITSLEILLACEDLGRVIRNRTIDALPGALRAELAGLAEMARNGNDFKERGLEKPDRGVFPKLLDDEIEEGERRTVIANTILAFALSCLLHNDQATFDQLTSLDGNHGLGRAVYPSIAAVLARRAVPNASPHLRLAAYMAQLRHEPEQLTPIDFFAMQAQIFGWLTASMRDQGLGSIFSQWITTTWQKIIVEERFRLHSPVTTVPQLEKALSTDTKDFKKAAIILLAAEVAVGFKLSPELRNTISNAAEV